MRDCPGSGARPIAASVQAAAADWVIRRDAGATPEEEREFCRWLDENPDHQRAWTRLEGTWATLDRPRQAGMADWVAHEINGLARRRRRRRLRLSGLLALAGIVIIGVSWRVRQRGTELGAPAPVIAAARAGRQVLPDGSVVDLKEGAAIAVDFTGALRRVALRRGEALFQVAKNPLRPFVVEAGELEVRAVGTRFSVALDSTEVGVLVTEGRVAVNQTTTDSAGRPGPARTLAFVDAGTRMVVRAGAVPVFEAISPHDVDARLAWLNARLEFSNTPLAEAVALMNQHNRVQFVIADPTLREVRVSGFIRADNAEAFAGFLEAGFQIRAERRGANQIVLQRQP